MKKLLLIPALLAGTLLLAETKKYELSPMIGYGFTEGNLDIKNDGYPLLGVEFQFNPYESQLSPEVSLFYTEGVKYDSGEKTRIFHAAFNGVYTFNPLKNFTPFVKAGAGASSVSNESSSFESGFFLDSGAGVKAEFSHNITLKLEAIYMAKLASDNRGYVDSTLLTMVGLTFAFGGDTKQEVPKLRYPPEFVDGDDDNDSIPNSQDDCPNTPFGAEITDRGCILDSDGDGVQNLFDECDNTPEGTQVDSKGCKADNDEDGVLNTIDQCKETPKGITVNDVGCNIDEDFDGVLNERDLCPNTPLEDTVNSDGCPKVLTLKVTFKSASAELTPESINQMEMYSYFLINHPEYSAKIIGYTDSIGSAKYNKLLSKKRAQSVVKFLIRSGVKPTQLSADGMGESNPIASNETKEGRAKNRRIEAELTRDTKK